MQSPQRSPSWRTNTPKAPTPSPALLALQEQGFELSPYRRPSTQSVNPPDRLLQISPLSISSTPSDLDKPLPLEPYEKSKRASSTYSADTTVTKIVQLYANKSQQSLESPNYGYKATTPVDDYKEKPPFTYYQPKAYRDTVAPLLQHQHSSSEFHTTSAVSQSLNNPSSCTSLPVDTRDPFLRSRLQSEFELQNLAQTPSPRPLIQPHNGTVNDGHKLHLSRDTLETISPLSKERQESWYDEPISPVSPSDDVEIEPNLAESLGFCVSEIWPSVAHQRQLAYDALSPPSPQCSPRTKPVDSFNGISESSEAKDNGGTSNDGEKSHQHALPEHYMKLRSHVQAQHKPSEASIQTLWPAPETQFSLPIFSKRPSSTTSRSTDSFVIHETLGGHVKAMIKKKLGKTKRKVTQKRRLLSKPEDSPSFEKRLSVEDQRVLDFATLKYPAMAGSLYNAEHRRRNSSIENITTIARKASQLTTSSVKSGPGPAVLSIMLDNSHDHVTTTSGSESTILISRQPAQQTKPRAKSLTPYQKYGVEIWSASSKKKRKEQRAATRRAAALENISGRKRATGSEIVEVGHVTKQVQIHLREGSKNSAEKNETWSGTEGDGRSLSNARMKKIFRTSAERRREKLKESIMVIVGSEETIANRRSNIARNIAGVSQKDTFI